MYSTSSTNYNTCRQTSALPFLPHPPKCAQQQQHSAGQSSSSSSLLYGADLNDGDHDDTKHSDDLQDFLNLSGDASESSFHGESKSMAFNDHMEIHFLSEQLGIAMTNNEDSPRLDDIYNGPSQLSSCLVPSFSDQENPRDAGSPLKVQLSSSRAACLTIYHVKSHLQKYRFAKYLPETKGVIGSCCMFHQDKRYSSEDNKAKLATHGNDAGKKKSSQVAEALRMQMEVQKQLHEQLEVQRQLQLRIEEHARYLQKILEQQQKARNCSSSMRSSVEELPESTDQEKTEMKADTTSTHLSNHKISDTDMKYNTLDKNAKLQVNLEEKSLLS
ncbi:hypothetical protein PR202_gb06182 [Eleusine coracana subsp. coracana]|uniref:MYB-CC type transcription factor LHEQLE-containing domain-containing protein n=1 Tax=Eleusine coracana subsp. coracana TaxID=191504 RepID=A0AAV5E8X1_ELECO|nr:hypothetical protein PR202_gb06182 [Eleusine coracana subsp. coracana]